MSIKDRLCDIFLIARSIAQQCPSGGADGIGPVRLLESVLPAIEANAGEGFKIQLERREWPCNQFNSALFRYNDHAKICYSHHLNLCWRRFAICKEAAHLLIDDSKRNHFTTDVVNLVAGLITSAPMMHANTPIESEQMGVIAAIELLLPWKCRDHIKAMQSNKSDFEIAEHFRVPEKFVNVILRTSYGDISRELHRELDGS